VILSAFKNRLRASLV